MTHKIFQKCFFILFMVFLLLKYHVAQAGPEFAVLLPQYFQSWDYRCMSFKMY